MFLSRALVPLVLVTLAASPAAAKERKHGTPAPMIPSSSETLPEVLGRFDQVQVQIRTLSAEFVQTTRSPLLKDPIVARGRFYLTKPDSVLWEYSSPEPMRFVVAEGFYLNGAVVPLDGGLSTRY